jgi:hypothetical protein
MPACDWRMTMRLPPSMRTSQSGDPEKPTGWAWLRAVRAASFAWPGSRTKKLRTPPLVESSRMPTPARRISRRMVSSIPSSRWRATSGVSASSSKWLPPARSRPRLIFTACAHAGSASRACAGSRLGTAISTPIAQIRLMPQTFQRGKYSIRSGP